MSEKVSTITLRLTAEEAAQLEILKDIIGKKSGSEAIKYVVKEYPRFCTHYKQEAKEHGELILNIIFRGIAMIYTVKRIDEDLDFGCEERPKGVPVMAIVTLTNSSGEEIKIKAEDAMLYECNINEGDKVCLDVNNKLEKMALPN